MWANILAVGRIDRLDKAIEYDDFKTIRLIGFQNFVNGPEGHRRDDVSVLRLDIRLLLGLCCYFVLGLTKALLLNLVHNPDTWQLVFNNELL